MTGVPFRQFVKRRLSIGRLDEPAPVGMSVGVDRNVATNDDSQILGGCFAALFVEPGNLLWGDEAVVRIAMGVPQEQKSHAPVVERRIDGSADMLLEQLVRIVVPRNLVNRLLQSLARRCIDRILRLAATIHYVTQMQNELPLGLV